MTRFSSFFCALTTLTCSTWRQPCSGFLSEALASPALTSKNPSLVTCSVSPDGDDFILLQTVQLLQTGVRLQDEVSGIPFPHAKFAWEHVTKSNASNASSLVAKVAAWTKANIAKVNESSPEVVQRVQAFTNYVTTAPPSTTTPVPPTKAPSSNASLVSNPTPFLTGAKQVNSHASAWSVLAQHRREKASIEKPSSIQGSKKVEGNHFRESAANLQTLEHRNVTSIHAQSSLASQHAADLDDIVEEIMSSTQSRS
mmetsp:Transcript_41125/g.64332  ORF Transcript_41125/g.64332 Transcript_41125/m.64332 type:complete len:255 (+) Transcript_41125:103-867(+)